MTTLLVLWVEVAVAVALSGLAFLGVTRMAPRVIASAPDAWNRLGLAMLALAMVIPLGLVGSPGDSPVSVMAEDDGAARIALTLPQRPSSPATGATSFRVPSSMLRLAGLAAIASALALALRLALRARAAHRACAALPVVRARRRVRLCASDRASAPYSLQAGLTAFIVLPTRTFELASDVALVLAHEAHHLRRGHARTALALEALGCALPGAVAPWRAALGEVQEMAADASVLRRDAPAADYARCLVAAAERAAHRPVAAVLMASPASLHRRLQMILARPASSRPYQALAALACALALCASVAASAAVAPHVDASRAEAAARRTPPGGIEVAWDATVREALQRRLGNAEGRDATRAALARMPDHAPLMASILREHGLPDDLLAVVLVESGFRVGVRPLADPPGSLGAGPWQFIPSTARKYGLTVDDRNDERLEPRRSTEAAAAHLADLHAQLGDWPLALEAYNQGRDAVEQAIARGGTRDALELERRGLLAPYASRVLAGMLILRDPTLAD